ncbi:hypothetical protein CHS0354_003623 [Potamilus streckersoni]|uniref:Uncharacterized protein n=1 Tax=Potamilus streckersoni TaxID=2493646 RepID=A0AAE0S9G8_9BIVA|nr:hypothetical protein CHS0354_003623 [Potamilus streckersoni]
MNSAGIGNRPVKPKTHSILINKNDESIVEISSKDYLDIPMRPRAYTDPSSPKPKMKHHVHFDLPDIIVDDYSDQDDRGKDNELQEKANTAEGAFFVYTSPPRRRSNTCPSSLFSRKIERPGTPPPEIKNNIKKVENLFIGPQRGVSFSPHRLPKVTEELKESKSDLIAPGVTLQNKTNSSRKDNFINSSQGHRTGSDPDISSPLTSDTRLSRAAARYPHDTGGSHSYSPSSSPKRKAKISNSSRNSNRDSDKSIDHVIQSTA